MSNCILIIGGNGFIGKNLVECFLQNSDYKIVLIDKNVQNLEQNERIVLYECDVSSYNIKFILEKYRPDIIINSAATVGVNVVKLSPSECCKNNYAITKNIIGSIMQVNEYKPHVIFFSSSEVYDFSTEDKKLVSETRDINSRFAYGICKLQEENEYIKAHDAGYINVNIMRLFNIVGRYQSYGFVIPDMIKSLKEEHAIHVRNSYRAFCSVHFLTHTILNIVVNNKYNMLPTIMNFGTKNKNNYVSMMKLATLIAGVCNVNTYTIFSEGKDTEVYIRNPFSLDFYMPFLYGVLAYEYDVSVVDAIEDYVTHNS